MSIWTYDQHNEYVNSDGTLRDGFSELVMQEPDPFPLSDVTARCGMCNDIIYVADMDADMNIVWGHMRNATCDDPTPIR